MINISKDKNSIKLLEIEQSSLKSMLDIQKNLNKHILQFFKIFFINMDSNYENDNFKCINEATEILGKSNSNIETLNTLLEKINNIITGIYTDKYIDYKISHYNNVFTQEIDNIYENTNLIENFIHKISTLDLSENLDKINAEKTIKAIGVSDILPGILNPSLVKNTSEKFEKDVSNILPGVLNSPLVENTLIISEMQGKIILPYKIEEVNNILSNNNDKFSSLEDVIEKLYTKPIKDYKFSAISRFKEAYKLVINKEHKSKLQAFSLASELFTNLSLHPAIITACKSLDELDIYLACLEDNTLEDFPFFDIKFEIAPKLQKHETFI